MLRGVLGVVLLVFFLLWFRWRWRLGLIFSCGLLIFLVFGMWLGIFFVCWWCVLRGSY